MRTTLWMVLCLAVLSTTACGTARHYYSTTMITHEAMPSDARDGVAGRLRTVLDGHRIVWVDPDGKERKIQPGEGINALDKEALHALWLTQATSDTEGAEFDFRVASASGQPTPVSVLFGVDDSVRIISAPRTAAPRPSAPSSEELRSRYGVGQFQSDGAQWNPQSYAALDAALAALSPGELRALRGMDFIRQPRSRNPRKGAQYFQQGCETRIYIYNNSLDAARYQFVGDPSAPVEPMTLTALHEMGHALHERPSYLAGCELDRQIDAVERQHEEYNDQVSARNRVAKRVGNDRSAAARLGELDEELNEALRQLHHARAKIKLDRYRVAALTHRGPVIAAFERALGDDQPPTRYGEVSSKEAFAESFALFHADPNALRRASPRLHTWFARGAHLDALGDSGRAAGRTRNQTHLAEDHCAKVAATWLVTRPPVRDRARRHPLCATPRRCTPLSPPPWPHWPSPDHSCPPRPRGPPRSASRPARLRCAAACA